MTERTEMDRLFEGFRQVCTACIYAWMQYEIQRVMMRGVIAIHVIDPLIAALAAGWGDDPAVFSRLAEGGFASGGTVTTWPDAAGGEFVIPTREDRQ